MDTAKLSISQDSLTYQLISKKHGSVTRYYLRNMCLSSDILISKEDALKFVAQNIPSVEDSYQKIQSTVDQVVSGNQESEFPDIEDIEDIEWSEEGTVSAEDIEDVGDTVIHAYIPIKSADVSLESSAEPVSSSKSAIDVSAESIYKRLEANQEPPIEVPSRLDPQTSSKDWNPSIATLTVKDLEEVSILKEENRLLKTQNQELSNKLESLQSEQEKISQDLALSEEVNSNLRSQLATYRERLTNSSKDLEQLSNTLKTSVEAFEKAKQHAVNLEELAKYQDEMINQLEDKFSGQSTLQSF